MKSLLISILAASTDATLISRTSLTGLRGSVSSGQLGTDGHLHGQLSNAAPPSCENFMQMLGHVYYMRDQLDRTTGSLSATGPETGQEWFIDQGIGDVTPATLRGVVCPLLSNKSKPIVSLLGQPAQPTAQTADPAGEEQNEEQEDSTFAESLGLPSVTIPDWLGGASAEKSDPQLPEHTVSNHTVAEPPPNMTINGTEDTESPPVAPVGCPPGSMQNWVLAKLAAEYDGMRRDDEAQSTIGSTLEDLLSIEKGLMALYKFRGCPAVPESEFKTRHVCELHRDELAKALRLLQGDIPEVRSRLSALQSRLRDIDSGASNECIFAESTTGPPLAEPRQLGWCLELQSVVDGLLDGRPSQTQWLKDVGDGMQRLGTMSIQLSRHINDPVLKRDKIPLNALHALTRSWTHMQSTIQHLRYKGSVRARQVVKMDVLVLQLSALLRNVSTDEQCISEGFRMRYSARMCTSLRSQLEAVAKARQTDLDGLQDRVQQMMQTASDGLNVNKCAATPRAGGCWLRMPSGCPNVPAWKSADKWTRDVFGEQSTGAAESKTVCTVSRKIQMNHLCGVENAEMRFNSA